MEISGDWPSTKRPDDADFERDAGDKYSGIEFRLAHDRIPFTAPGEDCGKLITPGQVVTTDCSLFRGHGTYLDNQVIKSSLGGICESVNKLVFIRPLKCRYSGELGDVVIGRVTEVQQKRWKINVNGKLHAVLPLSSYNLPGGELRRRSVEDERKMRQYLSEGDLISAEVHSIYSDGSLSLHTRNLKYGKLYQGVLVILPCTLIKRTKSHFHSICGVSLIIGTNGYIWIYPTPSAEEESAGGFARNLDLKVTPNDREAISRVKCCIKALVVSQMMVYDTSIVAAFESSSEYSVQELLTPEVQLEIALTTQRRLSMEEMHLG